MDTRIAKYIERFSPDADPDVVRLAIREGYLELSEDGDPTLTEKGEFATEVHEEIGDLPSV
jgi:hypothetical protein